LLVITPPDRPRGRGRSVSVSPLAEWARGEELELLQPADPHADDMLTELRRREPDVLVIASYGVILKPALLELAPQGCLNVHASLLPRYRGASPIQAAILAGDEQTGVSVQRVVQELDAGDVLLERSHPIAPGITAGELLGELAELGGTALVEALDSIDAGTAEYTPQDPARVTVARKLKKRHGRIDWSRPALELERRVRAFSPWPGASFLDAKGRPLTLAAAGLAPDLDPAGKPPGTVLAAGERFVVAAGEGALELARVAPAGKREMTGAEYLRGARLEVGDVLPTLSEEV